MNLNCHLLNELHKAIIKKFKKRKVYSSFEDNIWGVDLADMQSLRNITGIKYLLCEIDLFSRYEWVVSIKIKKVLLKKCFIVPLKDQKGSSTVSAFQNIISEGRKPNKMWVDQGNEF